MAVSLQAYLKLFSNIKTPVKINYFDAVYQNKDEFALIENKSHAYLVLEVAG